MLGALVYGNSLDGRFVWDDNILVKDNVYIKSWSGASKVFTNDMGAGSGVRYSYFRPLQIFSYTVDHSSWGLRERGYHLTNIILHVLTALAVYWLAIVLFNDRVLSFFAGILFVAHPVHTEAVAYISGRGDPLAALFVILCLIFYVKHFRSGSIGLFALALISCLLALLSKESAIVLPLLILLYHFAFREKIRPGRFLCVIAVTGAYVIFRTIVLKSSIVSALEISTLMERVPGFFAALAGYARLLIFPVNLHMDYGSRIFCATEPQVLLGAAIFVILIVYALRKRNSDNLICFSVLWFFVALLPSSNIYPLPFYMAEHFLYLPSVGFFLILGAGLRALYVRSRLSAAAALIALTAVYSFLTPGQNIYWREPLRFYERSLRYTGNSPSLYVNLGSEYDRRGRHADAIALFKKAIALDGTRTTAYYNLAIAYGNIGEKEKAIAAYRKAIETDPAYVKAYSNLGVLYAERGDAEEAMKLFRQAIDIDPDFAEAYNNLGFACAGLGEEKQAVRFLQKATEINPVYAEAYYNLGNVYRNSGNIKDAVISYRKAILIDPDYVNAYVNLGIILMDTGNSDAAVGLYRKALEIDPSSALVHINLALAYYRMREYGPAVEHFDRAVELGFEPGPGILELFEDRGDR